ncbi:hypothetical protein PRIPAC_95363 [Pristionchus pacificus]|uniref:Uncharacterized protein n=1 Tax=Pristionchus pacificus TaxID=54126 RepID=A0A2A6BC40_PRIPA|nr:hypothetical protein PRIPAC_95363 [Pristionchus pacificus]|eukprot:PDM63438.1 hypothetical protein PRIPAC_53795 [Pristionchus pacificus]
MDDEEGPKIPLETLPFSEDGGGGSKPRPLLERAEASVSLRKCSVESGMKGEITDPI